MAQRQGLVDSSGNAVRERREVRKPTPKDERTSPRDFVGEVRSELSKVNWPTREEVIKYSIAVLIFVLVLTTFVAILDFGFLESMLWLFRR